jgi:hypothetical protein
MPPPIEPSPGAVSEAEAYLSAFLRVQPELLALPPARLLPVNLNVLDAITTSTGAWRKIQALRPRLATLPELDLVRIDKLLDYTHALMHLHIACRARARYRSPVTALAEKARVRFDQLFTDALALAKRGLMDPRRVAQVRSPSRSSHLRLGNDLYAVVLLLRQSWPAIAGKTPITEAELNEGAVLAVRLVDAIADDRHRRRHKPRPVDFDLRQRCFSLFLPAYEEARRAALYLCWYQADADLVVPSLWARRRKKKRHKTDVAEPGVATNELGRVGPEASPRPLVEAD